MVYSKYPAYSCNERPIEELATEIIQKTSGILSVIGSGLIVLDVLRKLFMRKETNGLIKWTDSYQRIMLGLSFFDLIFNFFLSFLGSWMTPQETGWVMAIGNQATCTTQGFFYQFGWMASIGYQIALSLNILLLIAFGWSQEKVARTVEIPIHLFIITISLAYSIVPLPLKSYNAICGQCTVAAIEYECRDNDTDGESCIERGSPTIGLIYEKIRLTAAWGMIIFCTLAMIWVYIHVRRQEAKQATHNFPGDQTQSYHKESRRIRKILFLYTIVLYVSWGVPTSLSAFYDYNTKHDTLPRPLVVDVVIQTLFPLKGFFNMLVYFLPNCLKYQKEHPGIWLVMSYWHILISSSTSCCSWCSSLFKNVIPIGTDATNEEMLTDSPDMNFATYNTLLSHNIDTNASLSGDRSGNGSESQSKENAAAIATDVEIGGEVAVVQVQN